MGVKCELSSSTFTVPKKRPAAQWLSWKKALDHHRAMVVKYRSIEYPPQGVRWRDNLIAHHECEAAHLEAAEPSKYGD